MLLSGAQIIMECLLEQGVDTVFGYPGSTILGIYDELYRYRSKIKHILTSHEQGAAHAADGYARASGKPGVCLATSGPGATNLTTGIATAFMDSSPVVFITCNVSDDMIGKDAFQEVDIIGISMPITKCNYIVADVKQMAGIIREGFAVALSGRPGPVLIDIPKNVLTQFAEYEYIDHSQHYARGCLSRLIHRGWIGNAVGEPQKADIDCLVNMINYAKKPLFLVGGGMISANASNELLALVQKSDIPVVSTLMGLGVIPSDSRHFIGMAGMHGTKAANFAMSTCDLLIAVGVRFSDRITGEPKNFAQQSKIVHIDIDQAEIEKNVHCDLKIHANAKKVLSSLLALVSSSEHEQWNSEIASKKVKPISDYRFTPENIIRVVNEILEDNVLIVTDVGQHQMWSALNFCFKKPRQLITSGGFGTMGFGLGAALGAKLSNSNHTVIHITGDGCFRMNCIELATEEHYNIPVISIIFNNGTLGMVRQWQALMYGSRYSYSTLDRGPDFVKLADAYNISGKHVSELSELKAALTEALNSGKGAVIDCMLDIDAKVTPMLSGRSLSEYILD